MVAPMKVEVKSASIRQNKEKNAKKEQKKGKNHGKYRTMEIMKNP